MVIDCVAQMDSDVYLLIVGDGSERERLEARAAGSGAGNRITFAGWVHQPVDWLAAADVFVLTSRIESFGLVYAEAMMMGLPCIGSAHDPPEITSSASDVIPEGEVGFCVNSGVALLERLRFLRDNSEIRAQMGRKAEQLARNHYGIDNFIECIERTANALNAPKSKAI
jgi:glycosyltransferase involved in cell wall biosynthesis